MLQAPFSTIKPVVNLRFSSTTSGNVLMEIENNSEDARSLLVTLKLENRI
jgi:hypothetical protein